MTPPPASRQLALTGARSPVEQSVGDGKTIYLENPHHTTDQGYCMTMEYYQGRYEVLKAKVYWLPPNSRPSQRFLGLLLRYEGTGWFPAPKWRQLQSEKFATPETKQPRQVGNSSVYVMPDMKEPVPRDMEHAEMQIEVCMHGFFMAEIIPHFNTQRVHGVLLARRPQAQGT